MSLSNSPLSTPDLAPMPSALALARSRAMREVVGWSLPRSILFAHGSRDTQKRVALTFDDGPHPLTPKYLDVLDRVGARATFFFLGEHVARDPGLAREVVARGHAIGGHGWTHVNFPRIPRGRLVEELKRLWDVMPETPGRRLVRPPRGALSLSNLLLLASSGYTTVLWSHDSDDCRTCIPSEIAWRMAPARLTTGDIVLMHDGQDWTLSMLPAVVDDLASHGWQFVTVRELME